MSAREQYKVCHREARINARHGRWLVNPVRVCDWAPGFDGQRSLFVGADGQPRVWGGFFADPLFPVVNESRRGSLP